MKTTDDMKHVAYLARNEAKTFVVVDHRAEPAFDNIGADAIRLSHDGSQVVYPIRLSSSRRLLVRNGKELPESEFCGGFFAFSPDGSRYAYPVLVGPPYKARLYCDGEVVADHEGFAIESLSFSSNSKYLLYVLHEIKQNGEQRAVINGRRGPMLDSIQWAYPGWEQVFFFSPDHKRVAYAGQKDGKSVLVVDNDVESCLEDAGIINILFSPDGSRVALVTSDRENTQWRLSCSKKSVALPVGYPVRDGFHFNRDGTHFALLAKAKAGQMVIVDGAPGPVYTSIDSIRFLTDHSIQYVGVNGADGTRYLVVEDITHASTPGGAK